MPFLTQSRFPRLWLLFQRFIGCLKGKQDLAVSAWNGQRRILEIGCSVGNIADVFRPLDGIFYTGIDIDSKAIHLARARFAHESNFRFLHESVEETARSGAQYDYILIAGMLHHVCDATALAILSLTRPMSARGGVIVVCDTVLLNADDPIYMHWFYKLERGLYMRSHYALEKLITEAGLHICKKELTDLPSGLPMCPPVARFVTFVAAWDAV